MKIEFLKSFKTGHAQIDRDHAKIVDIINDVSEAINNGSFDICDKLSESFLQVTNEHFDREEKILHEIGFPNAEEHKRYHDKLKKQARIVKSLCEKMNDKKKLAKCFDEMVTFVIDDIIRGDMEFVSFMIEEGIIQKDSS